MQKNGSTSRFEDRLDQLKESVRAMVNERATQVKDAAADAKDAIVRKSGRAVSRVGNLIKDHPIAAIGIAFGVGYLAVRLLRR